MSIFNNPFAVKAVPTAPTTPTTPTIPDQPPLAVDPAQIQPNAVNPADPAAAGVVVPTQSDPQTPENPLDNFKDLYSVDPNAPATNAAPNLELTDEMLAKVIPSLDFQAGLSPEVVQGLQSGDPKSITAALSQVGANAYKLSMQHQAALVNDHVTKALQHFKPEIASTVDANLTQQHLQQLPNADNPVIQAELTRVSTTLRSKYPQASPEWVAEQANTYLIQLGAQLAPQTKTTTQNLPQSVDFAELLRDDN